MNITAKNRNRIYWGLQLTGWGFLNLISVIFLQKLSTTFLLFSIIAGISIGVFVTNFLRQYLRKYVHFETFGWTEIIKIATSTIIAAALYASLNLAFGFLYAKYGPALSDFEKDILKAFDSPWILIINSLFIISCWVICYLVIKLLLKINKDRIERLELNDTLKQAQLNTLKGQINPHFMFNSLNNIRGLMLEDVEKSRDMLTKLSEMLRYSLTKNNVNAIAIDEELQMVNNYIALSKIQFEHRLEYIEQVPDTLKPLQIPPMIIQLLIENAAKHGIANLKAGGKITLRIFLEDGQLFIEVANTGKLSLDGKSTQLGLKNIRQRIKILYGDNAKFTLNELDDQVVAKIILPQS